MPDVLAHNAIEADVHTSSLCDSPEYLPSKLRMLRTPTRIDTNFSLHHNDPLLPSLDHSPVIKEVSSPLVLTHKISSPLIAPLNANKLNKSPRHANSDEIPSQHKIGAVLPTLKSFNSAQAHLESLVQLQEETTCTVQPSSAVLSLHDSHASSSSSSFNSSNEQKQLPAESSVIEHLAPSRLSSARRTVSEQTLDDEAAQKAAERLANETRRMSWTTDDSSNPSETTLALPVRAIVRRSGDDSEPTTRRDDAIQSTSLQKEKQQDEDITGQSQNVMTLSMPLHRQSLVTRIERSYSPREGGEEEEDVGNKMQRSFSPLTVNIDSTPDSQSPITTLQRIVSRGPIIGDCSSSLGNNADVAQRLRFSKQEPPCSSHSNISSPHVNHLSSSSTKPMSLRRIQSTLSGPANHAMPRNSEPNVSRVSSYVGMQGGNSSSPLPSLRQSLLPMSAGGEQVRAASSGPAYPSTTMPYLPAPSMIYPPAPAPWGYLGSGINAAYSDPYAVQHAHAHAHAQAQYHAHAMSAGIFAHPQTLAHLGAGLHPLHDPHHMQQQQHQYVSQLLQQQQLQQQSQFKPPVTAENKRELFNAVRTNRHATVVQLLDQGVPCDITDEMLDQPLHVACQIGSKRMVKALLRVGASLSAVNIQGQSCLHFCFAHHFDSLAAYLISKGADDQHLNVFGLTCYQGLRPDSIEEAIELIEQNSAHCLPPDVTVQQVIESLQT